MAGSLAVAGCAHPNTNRPYVASLDLSGVHLVSERQLKDGLASRPPNPYDQLELERDRTRVQRFYEGKGFFATKVIRSEGLARPGSNAVDVHIGVEEGPPTLIGDVAVFGIDGLDPKTRYKLQQYQLGLQRGQVFHHEDYLKFKESLTRELKKRGYPDTVVEGVVDIAPANNLANIVVKLHPRGAAADAAPASPSTSTSASGDAQ